MNSCRISPEDFARAVALYQSGHSATAAGAVIGVSDNTLIARMREAGIAVRRPGTIRGAKYRPRKRPATPPVLKDPPPAEGPVYPEQKTVQHWRAFLSGVVKRRGPSAALDTAATLLAQMAQRADSGPAPPPKPVDPKVAMAMEMIRGGRVLSTIVRTTGLRADVIRNLAKDAGLRVRSVTE